MFYDVFKKKVISHIDTLMIDVPYETKYVVAVPHAGIYIPEVCFSYLNYKDACFIDDIDHGASEIYDLASHGGAVIKTLIHRHVVDCNRIRDYGSGTMFPEFSFENTPLYSRLPEKSLKASIQQQYHAPFIDVIYNIMLALQNKGKVSFLLNAHTMTESPPLTSNEVRPRPDFCIGTLGGTSADVGVIRSFTDAFHEYVKSDLGNLIIGHDHPFQGGGLSEMFGRPDKSLNTILLEVNDRLFDKGSDLDAIVSIRQVVKKTLDSVL